MSDYLMIQPFAVQLRRILKEYEATQSIFGIHKSLFYTPQADAAIHGMRSPSPMSMASTWPRPSAHRPARTRSSARTSYLPGSAAAALSS